MMRFFAYSFAALSVLTAMLLSGCSWPAPPDQDVTTDVTPAFDGTVGSLCELTGYSAIQVEGFALVIGLPETGSAECPTAVRDYLMGQLRKLDRQKQLPEQYVGMNAERILADKSTAVVMVKGLVPAGAPKDQKFDLEVTALEATQTTSLQGGTLLSAELRVVVTGQAPGPLVGRPSAMAQGPIFVNPFPVSAEGSGKANPRRGVVLGGGTSLYDREIRLVLLRPDFRTAQQIQNRINGRFKSPDDPWVARARREFVVLRVPDSYRDAYDHFIDLVWALYLRDTPGYLDSQLRVLDQKAGQPGADYRAIALAWESIGKNAIPFLQRWYKDVSQGEVAYYAAKTALAMEDGRAVEALTRMALQDGHPCQLRAAEALSKVSEDPQVRMTLHGLLSHDNYRMRIIAYEGLHRIRDAAVVSEKMDPGFRLDVVKAPGRAIVNVWATKEPRVALFGSDVSFPEDLFYCTADESVTLNARPGDDQVTVTRRLPGTNRLVKGKCSRRVADVVRLLATGNPDRARREVGALSFSQIAGLLYDLCDAGVIDAHFQLHRVTGEMVG